MSKLNWFEEVPETTGIGFIFYLGVTIGIILLVLGVTVL